MATRRRSGLNPKFNLSERIGEYGKFLAKSTSPFGETEEQRRLREIEEDRRANEDYYEDEEGEDLTEDFTVVHVIHADEYYQGPMRSTRVSSYIFKPIDSVISRRQFGDPSLVMGYLYIKWVKGTNVSRFGPMSVSDYRDFTNSTSYGQKVVELQSNYDYQYDVGAVEGL